MSLRIADREAERSLAAGESVRLSGIGKRYLTRTTRATQSLNQVARSGALTTAERQELDVVSGLVVDYGTWIDFAQDNVGDPPLRAAGLSYARSMLCTPPVPARKTDPGGYPSCEPGHGSDATAVVDRISALEESLRGRLAERAALGGGVLAAAGVAAACLALLGLGLWRTQVFLRHRFHLRSACRCSCLAAAARRAVPDGRRGARPPRAAAGRHHRAPAVRRVVAAIEATVEERPFGTPDPRLIASLDARADRDLAGGRLPGLGGAAPWVAPAGLLSAALSYATLHSYRREYVLISRSGAAL